MDRIERHDILNALALALVLLVMAFVLALLGQRLVSTVKDDGVVNSAEKSSTVPQTSSSTSSTVDSGPPTTEPPVVHAPTEVKIIVVNSARVSGIAGQGSDLLKPVGYQILTATNGNTVAQSVIYYRDGFEGDAAQVATLLGMSEAAIQEMPSDLDFNVGEADLAAVIGGDQVLR